MLLATYLPRLALKWAARWNGAFIGNCRDYWQAPQFTVVTFTAADELAMEDILSSFRAWAVTYRGPTPPPEVSEHLQSATDEIKALRAATAMTLVCTALCRRPYPTE